MIFKFCSSFEAEPTNFCQAPVRTALEKTVAATAESKKIINKLRYPSDYLKFLTDGKILPERQLKVLDDFALIIMHFI